MNDLALSCHCPDPSGLLSGTGWLTNIVYPYHALVDFPRDHCLRGGVIAHAGNGQWVLPRRQMVQRFLNQLWSDERGQDIAEYAVMLAVVLVIVVGTIRLIGANANNVFSSVASSISQ